MKRKIKLILRRFSYLFILHLVKKAVNVMKTQYMHAWWGYSETFHYFHLPVAYLKVYFNTKLYLSWKEKDWLLQNCDSLGDIIIFDFAETTLCFCFCYFIPVLVLLYLYLLNPAKRLRFTWFHIFIYYSVFINMKDGIKNSENLYLT